MLPLWPRFLQGTCSEAPYAFYHWHHIDIFNYFTHTLVTIPPAVWTSAAHKHGVVVIGEWNGSEEQFRYIWRHDHLNMEKRTLDFWCVFSPRLWLARLSGTFITEWKEGAAVCEAFLKDEESYRAVADKLVQISHYYGFDGWLINIENKLSVSRWRPHWHWSTRYIKRPSVKICREFDSTNFIYHTNDLNKVTISAPCLLPDYKHQHFGLVDLHQWSSTGGLRAKSGLLNRFVCSFYLTVRPPRVSVQKDSVRNSNRLCVCALLCWQEGAVKNTPLFLRYLTDQMHERVTGSLVVWYDSVLETGNLDWQNQLNQSNK